MTTATDVCGCPTVDGMTYHQRGPCADPVVAALDWYADQDRIEERGRWGPEYTNAPPLPAVLPALLLVPVTAAHIAAGNPKMPCGCPLALATADALGIDQIACAGVAVDWETVDVDLSTTSGVYDVDPDGQRWIQQYDEMCPNPQPITITLTLRESNRS